MVGLAEHPRATGNLLAQQHSGSTQILWAATESQGVKRSVDDGMSWDKVALAGKHLRGIAIDPNNPDHLFVAVAHEGLWETFTARTTMTLSRVPGSPSIPEELTFVKGKLYVAAHEGVYAYDGSWTLLSSSFPAGAIWESITGHVNANNNVVLYVGGAQVSSGKAVMKSINGGATWTAISTGASATIKSTVYESTRQWWATVSVPYLRFAGPSYVASQMLIDPDDANSLLVAGRGGAWKAIQSTGGVTWWPAMNGLSVTVNMTVVADPKVAARVYVGNMDYTFLGSADHGVNIIRTLPQGAPSTGDSLALDPETAAGMPSAVYLGASQRGAEHRRRRRVVQCGSFGRDRELGVGEPSGVR